MAPGARLGTVRSVLGEAWLLTTVTLLRVTLPELRTVPVKVMGPPAVAVVVGHTIVTAMAGAVVTLQVVVTELETGACVHVSLPVAVKVQPPRAGLKHL